MHEQVKAGRFSNVSIGRNELFFDNSVFPCFHYAHIICSCNLVKPMRHTYGTKR